MCAYTLESIWEVCEGGYAMVMWHFDKLRWTLVRIGVSVGFLLKKNLFLPDMTFKQV